MISLETSGDMSTSALEKPCMACRRRKVKCSKTRPCSNCSRSKQLCVYDGDEADIEVARQSTESYPSPTDGEIRERLARLEKLMEMMLKDEVEVAKGRSPEVISAPYNKTSSALVGQILFQEHYSAYFDFDFWAGLVNEIEDLRRLFDPPTTQHSPLSWVSLSTLGLPPLPSTGPNAGQPSTTESNLLFKLFFETVNPFVRVLHEAHFGKELDRYRRGSLDLPLEFEALLWAIYLLTVNSLCPETVQNAFSISKSSLVTKYQSACQSALAKVDFYKTDKVHTLQALIHYLTFLFQQNLYQEAKALLGIASRLAQTMGHHRDPRHFPYSPWVCEIRRRIWNHLCCVNAMAVSFYGAESCLPSTSDAHPPQNANEIDWRTSRFATPSTVPSSSGFTDMTFTLIHRTIADATLSLAHVDPLDFEGKEFVLRQVEADLQNKYLYTDTGSSSYQVAVAYAEVRISSLRLSHQHRQTHKATASATLQRVQPLDLGRNQTFISAIELLEGIERHSQTFASHNWSWIFTTIIPWLALATVLTSLPHLTQAQQSDIDRAQWQIDRNFRLFEDPEFSPVSNTPMWRLLVGLRESMLQRPTRSPRLQTQESKINMEESIQPSQDVATMVAFAENPVPESDMYYMDSETFLYEDQFMQDLPWLNLQIPF